MLDLDARTVFFFGVFVDFIAFTVILALWHQNHRRYHGLTYWLAGLSLQVLSQFLIGMRDYVPIFFSSIAGNILMVLALALVLTGLESFLRKPGRQLWNYIMVAVIVVILYYFKFIQPSFEGRVMLLSAGLFILSLQCFILMLRAPKQDNPASPQLTAIFMGMTLVSLVRVILPLFLDYGRDLFDAHPIDSVMIMLLQILFLFLTYNLVLLVNQRLYLDTLKHEEALRDSRIFNENILNSAPNPIIVNNPDESIVYVNPAFEELTGYRSEEIIGRRPPYPWWPLEYHENYQATHTSSMKQDNERFERRYVTREGRAIWVEVSFKTIKEGEIAKYQLRNWVDITERKAAEGKIRELYQKEKAAHAELEEEAKTRGMFIDILAHELRTPLTPMLSSSDALKQLLPEDADDLKVRLADNIHRSTQVMAKRLEELLDVARHARGAFQITRETVDLKQFMSDVINRFRPTLEGDGRKLVVRLPENLPSAKLDSSRIEQVIVNLLSNAAKHSPQSGKIEFNARLEDSMLRIDIRDEGPGIPEEDRKNLFKPYHRARQDRKIPGLGLGLVVSKQIVDAHGGKIWVETQPGCGSTFSFTIPLVPGK